ncbi:MAG: hypothetical protein UU77_C0028G0016 [candidate division WWE3 bacterium GW2011_GWC1_41_7]|uniref:Uncharacterized protein n=1 Tax=candidate division WWE3 bacterium GW2011_GWC1_41_7 TaxID=1619119 RepID=A0A0G0X7U4_UNCKA|nr:MAG: hypothetical protein UU77_C0028G0016 [candidate division WWE3 bacterium GW2011_GWC1_41_7]
MEFVYGEIPSEPGIFKLIARKVGTTYENAVYWIEEIIWSKQIPKIRENGPIEIIKPKNIDVPVLGIKSGVIIWLRSKAEGPWELIEQELKQFGFTPVLVSNPSVSFIGISDEYKEKLAPYSPAFDYSLLNGRIVETVEVDFLAGHGVNERIRNRLLHPDLRQNIVRNNDLFLRVKLRNTEKINLFLDTLRNLKVEDTGNILILFSKGPKGPRGYWPGGNQEEYGLYAGRSLTVVPDIREPSFSTNLQHADCGSIDGCIGLFLCRVVIKCLPIR